jgi:hypothetical protein
LGYRNPIEAFVVNLGTALEMQIQRLEDFGLNSSRALLQGPRIMR